MLSRGSQAPLQLDTEREKICRCARTGGREERYRAWTKAEAKGHEVVSAKFD